MNKLFLIFIILIPSLLLNAQTLPSKKEIVETLKKANDYWLLTNPTHGNAFWDNAVYHTGNIAAYELTGVNRYLSYSKAWAEENEWQGAKGTNPEYWKYSYGESDNYVLFGDWQVCFQTYIDLYNIGSKENAYMVDRALEVMQYQVSTENIDYWWWVDGLYMVMPVMTKMYGLTGDAVFLDKMHEYFKYAQGIMYDEETGLFYRDRNYVYPDHSTSNGIKDFWARGNGWVYAALAKVLNDLPSDDEHRDEFKQIFIKMSETLKNEQQEAGFWTRSLQDPDYAPGYETSGTAFFTFGLAWGINAGLLSAEDYLLNVEQAWNYLSGIAIQENGKVGYVQPIGASASPGTYVGENSTANFGTGAFLLAASQVVHLADGVLPEKPIVHMDSIQIVDSDKIQVFFNRALDQSTSAGLSNYHIEGVSISNVELTEGSRSVLLTLSGISVGAYKLSINNIVDLQGNMVESEEWMTFNISRDYLVTASGYESGSSNYPENTLDGDLNTRWSSLGYGEWIMLDLEALKMINSVDIAFFKGNERKAYFNIEVSENGDDFVSVYAGESSGNTGKLETFDFNAINGRYVKINCFGNSSNEWNSITEIVINVEQIANNIKRENTNQDQYFSLVKMTDDVFRIKTNFNTDECKIEIFSLDGQLVYKNIFNPTNGIAQFNDLSLTPGVYIVLFSLNNLKKVCSHKIKVDS